MNFKKRVNGSWTDTPHYIHNTSTDTITSLPAVLYPNDTTATIGLKGNTVQSTTPTPQNPVMPNGTGERTRNLFDKNATNVNNGYITNGFLRLDGSITTNIDYRVSEYIKISQNQRYALYYGSNLNLPSVCFYDSAKNYISGVAYASRWHVPFTTPQNAEYLRLSFRAVDSSNIMLNLGSTILPYEPWGVKIPISSADTTTPVYLGQVQSTRRIKKLVLTGDENFMEIASGLYRITENGYMRSADTLIGMCSHFGGGYTVAAAPSAKQDTLSFLVSASGNNYMYFSPSQYLTTNDFKAYLQQQYAAGTPVTVWYVLATEETAVVNEPLMKIGEYADEVSGVTIPVTAGGDTLSVDTTVQPSEVTANYKGWHPVQSVHERDNGAWT